LTQAEDRLTPEQIDSNIASFDQIWTTIRDKHFDTTFGGSDWNALKVEYRPVVETASTMRDARNAIGGMLGHLGVSHCNILPKDAFEKLSGGRSGDGAIGIEVRLIADRPVIFRVLPGSPASDARVSAGWEIVTIGDEEIAPVLAKVSDAFGQRLGREYYMTSAISNRLKGKIGDSLRITFLDSRDSLIEKTIGLAERQGKEVRFSNLPPYHLRVNTDTLEFGIGYFSHTVFLDPIGLMQQYDDALRAFEHSPGLIIDVRGNPGGIGMLGVGMAGALVNEKDKFLGTMITRNTELKFVLNPRIPSYGGPVAVLVDALSASTSEIFAGGLKDIGRVRVFGSRSVGAALPAMIETLPNGDAFMHPMSNYISFSGKALEASGVIPDQDIPLTRDALLNGSDPVIEAAIEWIRQQYPDMKSGTIKIGE
jgi:carboxyl-terminal processing protease